MKNDILFQNIYNRTIFNEDNLDILKGINSNSIDLIYLDPPFNKNETFTIEDNKKIKEIKEYFLDLQKKYKMFSNENFEEVFKDDTSSFKDIWSKNDITDEYYSLIDTYNNNLIKYLDSIKKINIKQGRVLLFNLYVY